MDLYNAFDMCYNENKAIEVNGKIGERLSS